MVPRQRINIHNKVLVLRLNRLGHLPPAQYETEMLVESGVPVLVCEFGVSADKHTLPDQKLEKWRIPCSWTADLPTRLRPIAVFFWTFLTLLLKIQSQKPKFIIAHGLQEQTIALFLRALTGVCYVVHVHEAYEQNELSFINRLFLWLEGRALRKAEFLIFPEATRAKIYRKRYQLTSNGYLTFNCPRLRTAHRNRDIKTKYNIGARGRILLYLGGVGETNALVEAVEALVGLEDVYLFIGGWGDDTYIDRLRETIRKLHLQTRVFFLGNLESEKKWRYLDQADACYCLYQPIYLRLRHGATASNKLMEAIAAGIPVVTSKGKDFKKIVESLDLGVCVDPTPESIREGLKSLFEDRLAWQRRRKNALDAHRTLLNFEQQFRLPLSALQRLAGVTDTLSTEPGLKTSKV
jgi:glycosyltransferase involved in cell wall biosynthesis